MNLEKSFEKAREMIENSSSPFVFFDVDTDGSCSFIQFKNTFKQIKVGLPFPKSREYQLEKIQEIYDNYDLFIFVDIPLIYREVIEAISNRPILWIDHHLLEEKSEDENVIDRSNLSNLDNIFYLNPLNFNLKDHRCSSYLTYKICNKVENLSWAAIASVSDFYLLDILIDFYEYDKNLFNSIFKISDSKRKELFDFINKYAFDDEVVIKDRAKWIQFLSYDCELIYFKNFFDFLYKIEKSSKVIRILREVSKLTPLEFKVEILNGKIGIFESFSQVLKEYKEIYSKISKVKNSELVYVEHKNTRFSFNRQLSEELAYRKKSWKVIMSVFIKEDRNLVSCSFRGNNYDVNKLVKGAISGLSGNGGGHKLAAGCAMSLKDFEIFKDRIFKKFN